MARRLLLPLLLLSSPLAEARPLLSDRRLLLRAAAGIPALALHRASASASSSTPPAKATPREQTRDGAGKG